MTPDPTAPRLVDLRLLGLATAAWAGALGGSVVGPGPSLALAAGCVILTGVVRARRARRGGRSAGFLVLWLLLLAAVSTGVAIREDTSAVGPTARLAEERALVAVELTVGSDPRMTQGRFADQVIVRGELHRLTARDVSVALRADVIVVGDEAWSQIELGARVRVVGRLAPVGSGDAVALLRVHTPPDVVQAPGPALRAAAAVRSSLREATSTGPHEARGLVPALVAGDDRTLDAEVVDAFQIAGLTHLTAVSGTNLTLVLGALLVLGRGVGVSGRGVLVLGLVGVAAFVLVARPEPSVVRAATMGAVALVALGSGGRSAGVRALGVAVFVLLVLDPALAGSAGFALSVLATGGILLVAPTFRDALARWLPRWAAEAIAVPLAAQLACTPLVAALSGEVSLVAVAANIVVAPLVGPATVLGLGGAVLGLAWMPAARVVGWVACLCAQGIVEVAQVAAVLPGAAVAWSSGGSAVAVLGVVCIVVALGAPEVLRSPGLTLSAVVVLVLVLVRPLALPQPGWPPRGWVLVACDVGQGDALVLSAGAGEAVVVDAGPDPRAVDACLRRLGISRLAVVLLTHFHADHVDGLPGVLRGRAVGEIQVAGFREPAEGAAQVQRWAAARGAGMRVPAYGEQMTYGDLSWQVVAPRRRYDNPNDASLVLLVEIRGVRLLLTGDVEPAAQAALVREAGLAPVDVLKVPHHGSRAQDARLLTGLGARAAVLSVGEDNGYGHPAAEVLDALARSGVIVGRTDTDGDVAVVVRDGTLSLTTRGG